MSTALSILNKALNRLGIDSLVAPTFTSLTGYKGLVVSCMQEAQDLLMLDLIGSEPIALIKEQAITLAIAATTNALPTDLYHNRLNYLYGLNDDGENIGEIDIISEKDYKLNGDNATQGYIKAYPNATNLVFTSAATVAHSLVLNYIKTPTPLTTHSATCDLPAEFDMVLVYKTLQLALEVKDQSKSVIYEAKYNESLKRMRSSLNKYKIKNARCQINRRKYTATW